jgi:hypothetical protein
MTQEQGRQQKQNIAVLWHNGKVTIYDPETLLQVTKKDGTVFNPKYDRFEKPFDKWQVPSREQIQQRQNKLPANLRLTSSL